MTDATLVVDANSLHVAVSVGVDAHHFLTMLLLSYSDANVGIDAIGFERVWGARDDSVHPIMPRSRPFPSFLSCFRWLGVVALLIGSYWKGKMDTHNMHLLLK